VLERQVVLAPLVVHTSDVVVRLCLHAVVRGSRQRVVGEPNDLGVVVVVPVEQVVGQVVLHHRTRPVMLVSVTTTTAAATTTRSAECENAFACLSQQQQRKDVVQGVRSYLVCHTG